MKEFSDLQTDSRHKILNAAIKEFSSKGLAGARVDKIAQQAGINKAMIYYHFSSKENLYRVIIDSQIEKVSSAMTQVLDSGVELRPSLLELSEVYHTILGSDPDFVSILLHELADGGRFLKEELYKLIYRSGLLVGLKNRIEEGIRSGQLRDIDPRQVLISFIGMNLFYLLMQPIANSMWEIEDAENFRRERPAQIVDLFLRGLEVE